MPRQTKVQVRDQAEDDLLPEYHFDYRKAKPNRFAAPTEEGSMIVVLEPEVAAHFKTPEAVNAVLRALVKALPQTADS
jgi:hypothetical protein